MNIKTLNTILLICGIYTGFVIAEIIKHSKLQDSKIQGILSCVIVVMSIFVSCFVVASSAIDNYCNRLSRDNKVEKVLNLSTPTNSVNIKVSIPKLQIDKIDRTPDNEEKSIHDRCSHDYCDKSPKSSKRICEKSKNSSMMMCEAHCLKKYHGHCISVCDKTENLCIISQFCVKHCFQQNHGHCADLCDETENLCASRGLGNYCITHCNNFNHGHCSDVSCSSESNLCSESKILCVSHCNIKNHKHCIVRECEETLGVCDTTFRCLAHINETKAWSA